MLVSFIAKELLQLIVQDIIDRFFELLTEYFRKNAFKFRKIVFVI